MKTHNNAPQFFRGELVEVRSSREISSTLDADGKLDGVPFMPEMAQHCGKRVRVFRRAGKTCVEGHGLRRMNATVLLEDLRCNGSFHDGCQRNCLMFWKEAWLKHVEDDDRSPPTARTTDVETSVWANQLRTRQDDRYFCQSTELLAATSTLSRWNIGELIEEVRHGELSIRGFVQIIFRTVLHRFLGFDEVGSLVGDQEKNVKGSLGLEAAEWVDVKSPEEILSTLDSSRKNCGLEFVPSMSEYIGRRYQVDFPVHKIILEETGKMARLSNTVALKGVHCHGICVKNCPRNNNLYWREIWLRRAEDPAESPRQSHSGPTGCGASQTDCSTFER